MKHNEHWVLFIDDLRNPLDIISDTNVIRVTEIARTSEQARDLVIEKGAPMGIYFKHDLGFGDNAMNFINWLVSYDCAHDIIKAPFLFAIHDAKPYDVINATMTIVAHNNIKFGM